eukprot:scaffold99493_cov90-Phaeocystis_antarctica.AAC.3
MAPYANASLCTISPGVKAAALTRSPAGAEVPLCARLSVREGAPLPVGHWQQRPSRRAQLPPLERRRAGGRAATKVRRAINLNRHLAPAVQDHGVEAVALRGPDLLSRGQLQCQQRIDHVALQHRSHAILAAEGGAAALGELGRQRRPGAPS